MRRFWLKCLVGFLALFVFVAMAKADWLACDIPNVAERVTQYAIIIDDGPEIIIPYQDNGEFVLLYDVTDISTADFKIFSINEQGRRSEVSDPFVLLPRPSKSKGHRVVE